ncbi:TPA: ATP-binding cassette domain-containing protein, partial [Bacillus thuringiensis]|nr:ATP-binding cassette domain-containing protein [Bacillus thuringiensis]
MNNVVIIKELYKKFNNEYILNDINLELEEGKIYGVVGRNGSGKSILFKTISGLISPNKGQLIVFGESIGKGKFPKNL